MVISSRQNNQNIDFHKENMLKQETFQHENDVVSCVIL
jgi:hypothetical protein